MALFEYKAKGSDGRTVAGTMEAPSERDLFQSLTLAGQAPIRIVIISDYMCPNCAKIEGEVRAILASRNDVSFSAKHYPMCADCNEHIKACDVHPNSCRAARVAETAGILRGDEGFWRMHHLLFDCRGEFTDAELDRSLTELGYDVAEFRRIMEGEQPLSLIRKDVTEANVLGLYATPLAITSLRTGATSLSVRPSCSATAVDPAGSTSSRASA